jgi:hypothetical protein
MHILRWASIWLGLLVAATIADMPKAAAGVILITPEEAKLPAPTQLASTRAITRGPRIEVSNLDDGKLHSPLHFNLKFRAFGGSSIDLDSLSVTYLRGSNVDLTQRVRPYARPTGIDIPDAEVPPGEHAIRVDLKDSEGRAATVNFVLAVTPN